MDAPTAAAAAAAATTGLVIMPPGVRAVCLRVYAMWLKTSTAFYRRLAVHYNVGK